MSIQRRVLTFGVEGGRVGAYEKIYRMASIEVATKEFERQMSLWFSEGRYESSWKRPAEVALESLVVDQYHVACARDTARPDFAEKCHFLGQYEEYLVWFSTDMSSDFMTYKDLEHVLQAIEDRMAQYLGAP